MRAVLFTAYGGSPLNASNYPRGSCRLSPNMRGRSADLGSALHATHGPDLSLISSCLPPVEAVSRLLLPQLCPASHHITLGQTAELSNQSSAHIGVDVCSPPAMVGQALTLANGEPWQWLTASLMPPHWLPSNAVAHCPAAPAAHWQWLPQCNAMASRTVSTQTQANTRTCGQT
jgi:hypothetical protein